MPRLCDVVAALRAMAADQNANDVALSRMLGVDPTSQASILALVASCPDRGNVLPVSLQADCGCAELTECRAGKGTIPGRVTLRNCMDCRATAIG